MSNVLTVVYDKAEQKIDSVIAAAVNELQNLGHTVKEVRVMGDSGEAKVALNTIEGIIPAPVKAEVESGVTAVEDVAKDVADVVENKNPDGSSPTTTNVEGAPVDTPVTAQADVVATPTTDERRLALLAQLEALDKEDEAAASATPTSPAGDTPTTA